jgi:hypothetical protein
MLAAARLSSLVPREVPRSSSQQRHRDTEAGKIVRIKKNGFICNVRG